MARERRYPRQPLRLVVESPIELRMDSAELDEFSWQYGGAPIYLVRFPNGRYVDVDPHTWAALGRAWRQAHRG